MIDKNPYTFRQLPSKGERHKLFGSVSPKEKTKPIEKAVGIANVKHPIIVESQMEPKKQTTVGTFTFTSSLPQTSKGTNMSRFTEQLNKYYINGFTVNFATLKDFTKELSKRLKQRDATMEVSFPWFFERKAPQTEQNGLNYADVTMSVTYDEIGRAHV